MSENNVMNLMGGLQSSTEPGAQPAPPSQDATPAQAAVGPEATLASTFEKLSTHSVNSRVNVTINQMVNLISQSEYTTQQNVHALTGLLDPSDNVHLVLLVQSFIAMVSDIKAVGPEWLSSCADEMSTKGVTLTKEEMFGLLLQKLGEHNA